MRIVTIYHAIQALNGEVRPQIASYTYDRYDKYSYSRMLRWAKREIKKFLAQKEVRAKLGHLRLERDGPMLEQCEANYYTRRNSEGRYKWEVYATPADQDDESIDVARTRIENWGY